jgi:hypothetical protein
MTALERLYTEFGQSPWLDNLTRGYLRGGTLERMDEAAELILGLAAAGVDTDDVGLALEDQGVAGFRASSGQVLAALAAKADQLHHR